MTSPWMGRDGRLHVVLEPDHRLHFPCECGALIRLPSIGLGVTSCMCGLTYETVPSAASDLQIMCSREPTI